MPRFSRFHTVVFAMLLCATLFIPTPVKADPRRIGQTTTSDWPSSDFGFSPDGRWVVYLTQEFGEQSYTWVTVLANGGTPVVRTFTPGDDVEINNYHISPDSQWIVYEIESPSSIYGLELYALPIGGGSAIRLVSQSQTQGRLRNWKISPDSRYVVYKIRDRRDSQEMLYRAVIGQAESSLELSSGLVCCNEYSIIFAPDGSQVVFSAADTQTQQENVYSANLADGTRTQISALSDLNVRISHHMISPDGRYVLYTVTEKTNQSSSVILGLYQAPIEGGTSITLAVAPPRRPINSFTIVSDSSRVVYKIATGELWDEDVRLYSIPIEGGTPILLVGPLPSGQEIWNFELTPDNTTLVYVVANHNRRPLEVYSVSLLSSISTLLGKIDHTDDIDDAFSTFTISPDSKWLVYTREIRLGMYQTTQRLYSVPIHGGTTYPLSQYAGEEEGTEEKISFFVPPDSSRVVFRRFGILWQIAFTGGVPSLITPLYARFAPYDYRGNPDGTRFLYQKPAPESGYDLFITDVKYNRVFLPLTRHN